MSADTCSSCGSGGCLAVIGVRASTLRILDSGSELYPAEGDGERERRKSVVDGRGVGT